MSDNPRSDAQSYAAADYQRRARSSSGPRGPPSVSTLGADQLPFEDDRQVRPAELRQGRAQLGNTDIPKVRDELGESCGQHFHHFLNE